MAKKNLKKLLYGLMIISFVPMVIFPLRYLTSGFFIFPQDTLWVIGTWLGLFAFMFIFWQYVLGIRAVTKIFTEDFVTLNKLHQTLGIYGFFLVIAHPTFIFISYLTERGQNLINLNFSTPFEVAVKIGVAALTVIIFNWSISYLFRKKFSFRWWKRLHLLNYVILPLVYFHAPVIGKFLEAPELKTYFDFLALIFVAIFLYRLGKQFGFFKYKYKVSDVKQVTHDVTEVTFVPVNPGKFIYPQAGQFIEIQLEVKGETHPFTAADYNPETHEVSLSPKASGPFSSALTKVKVGDLIYLDGPYGNFTRQAYKPANRKLIFIVGGIGVTPFLRFLDYFKQNSTSYDEVVFFYGNKTPEDIAYKDRFDTLNAQFQSFKCINILSGYQGDDLQFEKGFVTSDLIKKYLKEDLSSYKFFICGPPVMMDKMSTDLTSKGVSSKQIYMEKFSW